MTPRKVFVILWKKIQEVASQAITTIIDNLTSTRTDAALSANMGKELGDMVSNLKALGRFLSLWDCETGLPLSDPATELPYTYKTGDYYLIEKLPASGTKYKPSGAQYTGDASTAEETRDVSIGDIYFYDGTVWLYLNNTGGDVSFSQVKGQPSDNSNLASALGGKVDKVTTTSTYPKAYVKLTDGSQDMAIYTNDNYANSIVMRNANNQINVGTPANASHATTKQYVDGKINNSHVLTGEYDDTTGGTFTINVTTKDTVS